MERREAGIKAEFFEPVVVDGVGVRGGDRGAGGKIVGMDGADEAGMVDHHLRRPERRRRIARACNQFLPHAAVEKGDVGHRPATIRSASPPKTSAASLLRRPSRRESAAPSHPAPAP